MTDYDALREWTASRSDKAFRFLLGRHADMVHSVCLRMLRNPADAEEVAQDVFVTLFRKAGRLGPGTAVAGWLYRTAVNLSRARRRGVARRLRHEREQSLPKGESSTWEAVGPRVDEGLAELPGRLRDAIVLRFLEGMSQRDVAAALRCEEKAAEKRIARGLDRLRDYFARQGVAVPSGRLASLLATRSRQSAPPSLQTRLRAVAESIPVSGLGLLAVMGVVAATVAMVAGLSWAGAATLRTWMAGFDHLSREASPLVAAAARARAPIDAVPDEVFPRTREEFEALYRQLVPIYTPVTPEARRGIFRLMGLPLRDDEFLKAEEAGFSDLSDAETTFFRNRDSMAFAFETPSGLQEVLYHWASKDLLAAARWVYRIDELYPAPRGREPAPNGGWLSDIWEDEHKARYEIVLGRDLQRSLAWVRSLPKGKGRDMAACALSGLLASTDLAAAGALVGEMEGGPTRAEAVAAVAHKGARLDLWTALEWVERREGKERTLGLKQVASVWVFSGQAPEAAAALLDKFDDDDDGSMVFRHSLVSDLARTWGYADPAAALGWALRRPVGSERDSAIVDVVTAWGGRDPEAARAYIGSLPLPLRCSAIAKVTTNLLASPEAAWTWVEGLPLEDRERPCYTIALTRAQQDYDAAVRWVNLLQDEPMKSAALGGLASAALQRDLSKAVALARGLPEGVTKQDTYRRMASYWAGQDGEAALDWLRSLPASPSRDVAVYQFVHADTERYEEWGYCETIGRFDARVARTLIPGMGDATLRDESIDRVFRRWAKVDGDEARRWLAELSLSPEQERKLLESTSR